MSPLVLVLAAALPAPDAHSLANPAEVRPTHVALDLTVGFADKTIRGEALLTLEYPQGEEKADQLDLDTRELRIEEVTDETTGQPLTFTLEAPVKLLGQRLRIALPAAATHAGPHRLPDGARGDGAAVAGAAPDHVRQAAVPVHAVAVDPRAQLGAVHGQPRRAPDLRRPSSACRAGTTAVMARGGRHARAGRAIFRFKMPQPIPPYLLRARGRRDRVQGRGTAHRRLRGAGRAREGGLGVRGDGEDGRGGRAPLRALRLGPLGRAGAAAQLPVRRHGEPAAHVRDAHAHRRRPQPDERDGARAGALVVGQPGHERDLGRLLAERGLHELHREPADGGDLRRRGGAAWRRCCRSASSARRSGTRRR